MNDLPNLDEFTVTTSGSSTPHHQRTSNPADGRQVRYIAGLGCRCPFCDSRSLEGSSVEIVAGSALQPITCLACDKQWTDLYKLVGFEEN